MPEGYASRRNASCNLDYELNCGKTWGDNNACCPLDTYCPPNQKSTKCWKTPFEPQDKRCANSTWNLYYASDFFCCDQGLKAFKLASNGFVGCVEPSYLLMDGMIPLSIVASGTVSQYPVTSTSTPVSSSLLLTLTSTSTSQTSIPTSTPTSPLTTIPTPETTTPPASSSSTSNTGAIAGGVVGGVAGIAIIAGLLLFFLSRRSRASSKDGSANSLTPFYGVQNPQQTERKWNTYPQELGNHSNERQVAELPAHPPL